MISWGMGRLVEFAAKTFGASPTDAAVFGNGASALCALCTGDYFSLLGYQADLHTREAAEEGNPTALAINRATNAVFIGNSLLDATQNAANLGDRMSSAKT